MRQSPLCADLKPAMQTAIQAAGPLRIRRKVSAVRQLQHSKFFSNVCIFTETELLLFAGPLPPWSAATFSWHLIYSFYLFLLYFLFLCMKLDECLYFVFILWDYNWKLAFLLKSSTFTTTMYVH